MRSLSGRAAPSAAPLGVRTRRAAAAAPTSLPAAADRLPLRAGWGRALTVPGGRGGCLAARASAADGASSPAPSPSTPGGSGDGGRRRGPRSPAAAAAAASAPTSPDRARHRPPAAGGILRPRAAGSGRARAGPTERHGHGGGGPPPLDERTLQHLYAKGWWPSIAAIEKAVSKPGRFETFVFETAQPAIDYLDETLRGQPPRKNGLAAAASVLQRQPKLQTRRTETLAAIVDFLRSEGLDAAHLTVVNPGLLSRSLASLRAKLTFLRVCMGVTNEQLNTVWGSLLMLPQRRLRERFFYARWCKCDFLGRYSATTMAGTTDASFLARVQATLRRSRDDDAQSSSSSSPSEAAASPAQAAEEYRRVVASSEFAVFCAAEEAMLAAQALVEALRNEQQGLIDLNG